MHLCCCTSVVYNCVLCWVLKISRSFLLIYCNLCVLLRWVLYERFCRLFICFLIACWFILKWAWRLELSHDNPNYDYLESWPSQQTFSGFWAGAKFFYTFGLHQNLARNLCSVNPEGHCTNFWLNFGKFRYELPGFDFQVAYSIKISHKKGIHDNALFLHCNIIFLQFLEKKQ